ncbi:PHP domain-containing protein [Alkalihalobacillus sp. LMS39]|uniref:PHP domain-containing protein n=1 Tax=Alkalihalobacillus sp. LMS39 TaxID=2924032 RepID=UPI001FB4730B|nr:PHP domain-containing protein [Alkalihalobacillus sp. LMS39]UOE92638.1 PHP domain-containing protein [Alkalihalobacillus sp. LMS39]
MIEKNADLHMHSTASDGGYSPSELVQKCKEQGLTIISLTDHDTVAGVSEAIEAGQALGLKVIPGIEFSTKANGKSVHILGYGIDITNRALLHMLEQQRIQRRNRLDVILSKLHQVGITLQAEDVLQFVDGGSIGRPHVAKALIQKGYVTDVAEAFDRYLAEGQPCYVSKEKEMTPEEAFTWIHQTGGVAIVAHPVYYGLDELIEEWVKTKQLDGIEVYHRDHTRTDVIHYEQLTSRLEQTYDVQLLRTGGSDFHHEEYGRKREPLGVTRLSSEFAMQLMEKLKWQ